MWDCICGRYVEAFMAILQSHTINVYTIYLFSSCLCMCVCVCVQYSVSHLPWFHAKQLNYRTYKATHQKNNLCIRLHCVDTPRSLNRNENSSTFLSTRFLSFPSIFGVFTSSTHLHSDGKIAAISIEYRMQRASFNIYSNELLSVPFPPTHSDQ